MNHLASTRRTARKPHRCSLCRTTIEIGEAYVDARYAFDGAAWTWREHVECGACLAEVPDSTYDGVPKGYLVDGYVDLPAWWVAWFEGRACEK